MFLKNIFSPFLNENPLKQCHPQQELIGRLQNEAELSYWEKMPKFAEMLNALMLKLQDKFMGQSLNLAYESCGYVIEKLKQWKIRQNQAEKNSQLLLMIDR